MKFTPKKNNKTTRYFLFSIFYKLSPKKKKKTLWPHLVRKFKNMFSIFNNITCISTHFFTHTYLKKKTENYYFNTRLTWDLYIAFPFYFIIIFIHPFHLYKQNPKNGLILFITKQMQSPFIKGTAREQSVKC